MAERCAENIWGHALCLSPTQSPAAPDDDGVSVRFKILRVGATVSRPASRDARRRGCTCPVPENRGGVGWDVSDDQQLKGFWIDEECVVHRTALSQR